MDNKKSIKIGVTGPIACLQQDKPEQKVLSYISERLENTLGIKLPCSSSTVFCKAIESICIDKCSLKSHDIECNVYELHLLIDKLNQLIEVSQYQKYLRSKIKINDMRINLRISNNSEGLASKTEISKGFSEVLDCNEINRVGLLEKRLGDLEFKLEMQFLNGTDLYLPLVPEPESFAVEPRIIKFSENSTENFTIKKFAYSQHKVIQEKEWEAFEAKVLKSKYQKKLKKLSTQKLKVSEKEITIQKKNLEIEKQKIQLEALKSSIESQKSKQSAQISLKIQAIKDFISENLVFLNSSISIENEESLDTSKIESKISDLQAEYKDLENLYRKGSSSNLKTIEGQLDHIKTQLTTYRSLRVLYWAKSNNKTLSTNTSFPAPIVSQYLSPRHGKNYRHERIDDMSSIKQDEVDTELRKQLRVKELRIKEREEEAFINEQRAIKYWDHSLDTQTFAVNAIAALNELKKLKDKYENRLEFFDKKKMELCNKIEEISRREHQLLQLKQNLDEDKEKFEHEKHYFITKANKLLKSLEKN
jgi:hypothetical protein